MTDFFRYLWRSCFARNGHGIHSPFAFDLVQHVIEEYNYYYFYDLLDEKRQTDLSFRCMKQRELRLLYRLALKFFPEKSVVISDYSTAPKFVIQSAVGDRTVETLSATDPIQKRISSISLLYIDHCEDPNAPVLLFNQFRNDLLPDSVVIIRGINRTNRSRHVWRMLSRTEARMSMDLYDCGLMFFRSTLTRAHFKVHYRA
ncbi:MAG: hypothetical protein ACK5JU_06370 [Bacteroidales bacterium]